MTAHDLLRLVSALAIGFLLGFERERSHPRQAAGARTFALLGLVGALAAAVDHWAVAVGLLVVGALVVVGYQRTSASDPGATTEVSAIATYLLGALAWSSTALAAALAIIIVVLLSSKGRIHSFARNVVTDAEMEDALKALVMAFVVLPLLPDRDVGPYGVLNPTHVWQLVLALTAISWAGYIATRALGPRRGLLIAGLAGGFISASATTASMARLSRSPGRERVAVAGAAMASLATFAQLAGIIAVADVTVLAHLWPALAIGAAVLLLSTGVVVWADRSHPETAAATASVTERPFGLRPTLLLATVLTLAVLLGRWMVDVFGANASTLAAAAAGFADAHAGALASATLHDKGQIGLSAALLGVGAAITSNTVVKSVVAFTGGGRQFGLRFCACILPAFGAFAAVLVISAKTL